ncbi:hypothetical protein [Celeribacter sp.]|jgi:hypothetical protein|uniref:hypothetical protein n=1 Tax=Celeribacter sp. TaxID=1890673 RepID=UPI003A91297F
MWIVLVIVVAGFWLWRSNQKRAKRFVRAVHFLDALDGGATPDEANGVVAKLFTKHSNADADNQAIRFAQDRAQRWTQGKQLPWIHEARTKGFAIDSGSTKHDFAHLSEQASDEERREDLYVAAGIAHVSFLNAIKRDVDDEEFSAAALGAFDGTVQALGVKLTHVEMFSMGAAFVVRQLKDLGRLDEVDPERIADLTAEAMNSSALEEIRGQAGQVAYSVTMTMRSASPIG